MRALLTNAGIAVTDLRVRDLGEIARIELPGQQLSAAQRVAGLAQAVAQAGFTGARTYVFWGGREGAESGAPKDVGRRSTGTPRA